VAWLELNHDTERWLQLFCELHSTPTNVWLLVFF
jgi:hypothetical protein